MKHKENTSFTDQPVVIDPEKKAATLAAIAQAAGERKLYYRPGFLQIFAGQLRYFSVSCLLGQLCSFAVILCLFRYFNLSGKAFGDYLSAAAFFTAFIGIFGVSEVSRTLACGTAELEQVCCLNLKQLWCIRMMVYGILNLAAAGALGCLMAREAGRSVFDVGVYLLVPYLCANSIYFGLFTILRNACKERFQLTLGLVVGMLSLIPTRFGQLYEVSAVWIWWLALAAAASLLIWEIKRTFAWAEEGEGLCWN